MSYDRIQIGRRSYARFIPYPKPVTDGTLRCIACGQIDDEPWHEPTLCPGMGGALPQSDKVKAFIAANANSPIVFGSAQKGGGVYYRLKDGKTFRLSLFDVRATPLSRWDI